MSSCLDSKIVTDLSAAPISLPTNCFRFGHTSLESDKYICVKDDSDSGNFVVTIDMHSNNSMVKKPMKAEGTLMHWDTNIIALRGKQSDGSGGEFIQVFNLDSKTKLGVCNFDEGITFWKWIGDNELAVVTSTSVYHWEVSLSNSSPKKIFDKNLRSESAQVIHYSVNEAKNWSVLVGIYSGDGGKTINGSIQLFSHDKNQSQLLDGHCANFGKKMVESEFGGNGSNLSLFTFVEKKPDSSSFKLYLMDLSKTTQFKKTIDLNLPGGNNDFPLSTHFSTKYGIVYIATKMGNVLVVDVQTGNVVDVHSVSPNDPIFICTADRRDGGILTLSRTGKVYSTCVRPQLFATKLSSISMNAAMSFAKINGISGVDNLVEEEFKRVVATGDVDAILNFMNTYNYASKSSGVDFPKMIRGQLFSGQVENSVKMSKVLLNRGVVDPNVIFQIYIENGNKVKELTNATFDFLEAKDGSPEYGQLQTKLIELNLAFSPDSAEVLFQTNRLTQFDKNHIRSLCERVGLFSRALEFSRDTTDVKRILNQSAANFSVEFLCDFFANRGDWNFCLECLADLIKFNRVNLQNVIGVATKFHAEIGEKKLIDMFLAVPSWEGIYYFLGGILANSFDKDVHFYYIQAATKLGHTTEVERVCRETTHYDPEVVKDFLKGAHLTDPRPLIYVCDLHGYIDELTEYLYHNNFTRHIEVYVLRVNPQNCPKVLSKLIDLDCDEDFIKSIILSIRTSCDVSELIKVFDSHNRLRLLTAYLEQRISEGNTESAVHNALCKINIDTNMSGVEEFLKTNCFYGSIEIGHHLEDIDPYLSFLAYKRANNGVNTYDHLIALSFRNGLYKLLSKYLVNRQSLDLWASVLTRESVESATWVSLLRNPPQHLSPHSSHSNHSTPVVSTSLHENTFGETSDASIEKLYEFQREVIDSVVAYALPDSDSAQEVTVTVKAFMAAELTKDLLELLEKIVLHNPNFADNKSLENLLLLTSMSSADPNKVNDYINRLNHFDGFEVAKIAKEKGLLESAFLIYLKFESKIDAIETLIALQDETRIVEYGLKFNDSNVFFVIGKYFLNKSAESPENAISAVDYYISAKNSTDYLSVIEIFSNLLKNEQIDGGLKQNLIDSFVKFLQMTKSLKSANNVIIDNELIYAHAISQNLKGISDLLGESCSANLNQCGDRLFREGYFSAAKIVFVKMSNYVKLVNVYIELNEFNEALDSATRANNLKCWKILNKAALSIGEAQIATTAGKNILKTNDAIEDLVRNYESNGYYMELLDLVENSGIDNIVLNTELGILYSKYDPDKLKTFIRLHIKKINIPKLIKSCEMNYLYEELIILLQEYNEHDQVITHMMNHPSLCYDHDIFMTSVSSVSNFNLLYRAIEFYIEYNPLYLNKLLIEISKSIEPDRVRNVEDVIILDYLTHIQSAKATSTNTRVNMAYIELNDLRNLKVSINSYPDFDVKAIVERCEVHPNAEFRKIANLVYANKSKYERAISSSVADGNFKDAILYAYRSRNRTHAMDLLSELAEKDKNYFIAGVYHCYSFIDKDYVLEMCFKWGLMNFVVPFMVQTISDVEKRLVAVEEDNANLRKKNEQQRSHNSQADLSGFGPNLALAGGSGFCQPPSTGGVWDSLNGPSNVPSGSAPHTMPFGAVPSPHMVNGSKY